MRTYLMTILITLLSALSTLQAFSQDSNPRSNPRHRPGYCALEPSLVCEQHIKKLIPSWESDEESEISRIKYSCAGNIKASCLEMSEKKLARFDKDNLEDLSKLALSCQLTNIQCLDYVLKKLPRIDKNSLEDITQIAKSCARSKPSCIERTCKQRGLNCDRKEHLLKSAQLCYQPCR